MKMKNLLLVRHCNSSSTPSGHRIGYVLHVAGTYWAAILAIRVLPSLLPEQGPVVETKYWERVVGQSRGMPTQGDAKS
jgi:hypothetical protein